MRTFLLSCVLLITLALNLEGQESRAGKPTGQWKLHWNPSSDLYPRYVADPRRSLHLISIIHAASSEVPDSGNRRFMLIIGGQYPLIRFTNEESTDAWQLDAEARYFVQYDIENNLDELGHDARLGVSLAKKISDEVAIKVAGVHTSSHIGDEYILRNEITHRLSVRKEELSAGLSWSPNEQWRLYGEVGYGFNLGVRNEALRAQGGVEFESEPIWRLIRWFGALDVTSWEETDWQASSNLQAGLVLSLPDRGRWYRLGVALYDGRSQLDSFFLFDERYVVFGLWMEL